MTFLDPATITILLMIVAVSAWNFSQVQTLNRRLSALEKQYLALIQDLEDRLYRG